MSEQRHRAGSSTVGEFTDRQLVTVPHSGTMADVLNAMIYSNRPSVVVLDGEEIIGIASASDVGRMVADGKDLQNTGVSSFLTACRLTGTSPCVQIGADQPVINALKVMENYGISEIIVTRGNRLAGTITALEALKGWKKEVSGP